MSTVLGSAAIAATSPYLTLKFDWVLGGTVGMTGPVRLGSGVHRFANGATILLDLVFAGLVLTLIRPWGRRLPAAVVVVPLWCGTGLLGTILLLLPLAVPALLLDAQPQASGLAPWVCVLVYAGFVVQGVLLMMLAGLYTLRHWPQLRDLPTQLNLGRSRRQFLLVCGGVLACAAAVQAAWGLGVGWGVDELGLTAVDHVTLLVHGMTAGAASLGALRLARPGQARTCGRAGLLVWVGGAATVTWGGYFLAYSTADPSLTTALMTAVVVTAVSAAVAVTASVARPYARAVAGRAGQPGRQVGVQS